MICVMSGQSKFEELLAYFKREKPHCEVNGELGLGTEPTRFWFYDRPDNKKLEIKWETFDDLKATADIVRALEKSNWKRTLDSLRPSQKACLTERCLEIKNN